MENKRSLNKLFWYLALSFGILNILDLILTLTFFSMEVNPLVLNNPGVFYSIKMFTSWLIIGISTYFIQEKDLNM